MRQTSMHTTIEHHTIRDWAEQRAAHPVHTGAGDRSALGIHFRSQSSEKGCEPIGWDEFFKEFDERGLCFVYQERTDDGAISHVSRFAQYEGTEPRGPH